MAYRTRNATFKARLVWYMAYRTGNITFEARLFRYMAYSTRIIFTFEARFLWFMAYRTDSNTLEAHLFRFMHIERAIFLLKRTCFALWLIERGISFCTARVSLFSLNFRLKGYYISGKCACFGLWLIEWGILLLERACFALWRRNWRGISTIRIYQAYGLLQSVGIVRTVTHCVALM